MSTENPIFKRMMATGEEQVGKLVAQLVGNERFMAAVQNAVGKALSAKGALDSQIAAVMQAMRVPTTSDVKKINDRLEELERIFEGLSEKLDRIADQLDKK